MRSWDNDKGREGNTSLPKKKPCPHRVWFGEYILHYCNIDREVCTDPAECRHTDNLCKITTKEKDE